MPNDHHNAPHTGLSYYGLSLLSYLRESHPDLADDADFIRTRAQAAAETYSRIIRSGGSASKRRKRPTPYSTGGFISRYTVRSQTLSAASSRRTFPKRMPARPPSSSCRRPKRSPEATSLRTTSPPRRSTSGSIPNLREPFKSCSTMAYNKTEHLRRNIEAIRTAFALEREQRRLRPKSGMCCVRTAASERSRRCWSRCRTKRKRRSHL